MSALPIHKQHCILCTQDPELEENVVDYLKDIFNFWPVTTPAAALCQVERRTHCLVVIDLRFENAIPLLIRFARKEGCFVIALGDPGTSPYIEATNIGVYATADINASYGDLQTMLEQAAKNLVTLEESQAIASRLSEQATRQIMAGVRGTTLAESLALSKTDVISEILKKLHSPVLILETVLAEISRQFLSARIGVLTHASGHYQLRAGVHCPQETWNYQILNDDPFVRWIKAHGQLLSRKSLSSIENSEHRLMLGQMLDTFGADVLIPLTHNSTLLGWIFWGQQINGQSHAPEQFPSLLSLADQVADIVQFIADTERTATHQQLVQGIISSLPYGLVLVDETSRIVWSNELARHLLALEESHFDREVDFIDTILADVVHRAAGGNGRIAGAERLGKKGSSHVSIHGRTMDANPKIVLVIVEEASERLAEQQRAERVVEIAIKFRSALTLISTFSQLLTEKSVEPQRLLGFGESMEKQVEELTLLSKELGTLRKTNCLPA